MSYLIDTEVLNCAIKLYVPSGTGHYDDAAYWRAFEEIENLEKFDFEVEGICYNITSGTDLTVSVTYKGGNYNSDSDRYTGIITIPDSVTYGGKSYSVTGIGESAFIGCTGLTEVVIPKTVTSIEEYAFFGCTSLAKITTSESVTSVGKYAFNGTAWYNSQPKGVVYLDNILYDYKGGMPSNSSVTIKDGITCIAGSAFQECNNLKNISIPESVVSIGDKAFSECTGLTSIAIPGAADYVGTDAFYRCYNITELKIGDRTSPWDISITGLHDCPIEKLYAGMEMSSTWSWMETLKTLSIGDSTTNIAASAFANHSQLTSVSLGKSVKTIGGKAFYGCTGITEISIPSSVTSIDTDAFSGCSSLVNLTIEDRKTSLDLSKSGLLALPIETLYVGMEPFTAWKESLKTVVIGDSVTSIGSFIFSGFANLTSVKIGNSVESIGSNAFRDCQGLSRVVVPKSVNNIHSRAFYGCTNLTEILVDTENAVFDSRNNCNAIIETSTNTLVLGCVSTVIPSSVTTIGRLAFANCIKLTDISIPNSVTSIGISAFEGCTGLTNIIIPEFVTSIESGAFKNCSSLISVTMPISLVSIGYEAFYNCKLLENITIPNSVTSIGGYAFAYCSSITNIEIPNSVTSIETNAFRGCSELKDFVVPNSVTSIGSFAFSNCRSLTSFTVPNSLKEIGFHLFDGCTSLLAVVLPETITSIDFYAFNNCTSLTHLTIPESVTTLNNYMFNGCTNLVNLTIKNPTPVSIAEMTNFNSSATLTVPNGSAKAYKELGGFWGQFASIKEEASVNISEANKWSTCVLAFDAELPEGVRAFVSTGMDGNSVLMEEVTALEAYKPYVLYAQDGYEGTLSGVVDLTAYQETVTDGVLSGAIVKQETSSGYILQNQGNGMKFYNVNGQTFTIPAGKCWLSAFDASGASVTMRFTGGVTGIEGVYVDRPTGIEADETMYDLEGRRVENPLPGRVYIKGGKKVMLKN